MPLRLFLFFSFLLIFGQTLAQSGAPTRDLETFYDQLNMHQEVKYQPERGYTLLRLPSNFSTEELAALKLKDQQLVRVDLVYTAFRLDPNFSQRQLNIGRLRNLAAQLPGILENETLTWNLVEQTGCNSPAECQDFFHGFVLYLERSYTAADTKREADSLVTKLNARLKKFDKVRATRKTQGRPILCAYPQSRYSLKQITKRIRKAYTCKEKQPPAVDFRAEVGTTGLVEKVTLVGKPEPGCRNELAGAIQEGFSFTKGFRVGNRDFPFALTGRLQLPVRGKALAVTGYYLADSLVKKYRIRLTAKDCRARMLQPGEKLEDEPLPNPDADVVSKVLNRHPEWSKRLVVADVTGSMMPYTLDLLTWLQLSILEQEKTFVFFNDGNDTPDKDKVVGKTGGLYHVTTNDFASIKGKVLEAMKAGGGGDAAENDGEALLYAQQLVPGASEIILLADNHTFPRDTRLLKGTTANVRIILCGATRFVNTRYLALARKHGFTIHTIEGDITNLGSLLEGETITLQGARYQVTKDGFKLVKLL